MTKAEMIEKIIVKAQACKELKMNWKDVDSFCDEITALAEGIKAEILQENAQKQRQKVVRTYADIETPELQKALEEGWTVALVNSVGGNTLEYILEKTENLGNSKAVKNPEE